MVDPVEHLLYKSSANGSLSGVASWGGGKNVFCLSLFQDGYCLTVHISWIKQRFYVLLFQGGK